MDDRPRDRVQRRARDRASPSIPSAAACLSGRGAVILSNRPITTSAISRPAATIAIVPSSIQSRRRRSRTRPPSRPSPPRSRAVRGSAISRRATRARPVRACRLRRAARSGGDGCPHLKHHDPEHDRDDEADNPDQRRIGGRMQPEQQRQTGGRAPDTATSVSRRSQRVRYAARSSSICSSRKPPASGPAAYGRPPATTRIAV